MTRLRPGIKPGVGPVLKLMRNDVDHPFTTPNTDYHKFAFNSEIGSLSYLLGMYKVERGGPTVYPPGTNYFNPNIYYPEPWHRVETYGSGTGYVETHHIDFAMKYGLSYEPITELRKVDIATGRVESHVHAWENSQLNAGTAIYWSGGAFDAGATGALPPNRTLWFPGNAGTGHFYIASTWEFPGTNVAYDLPSLPPVSGQKVLWLRDDRARMTRPGYDVDTAIGRQFIFDSDRIPAKVLKAGELTLPVGGTVDVMLTPGLPPPGELIYVDSICRYTGSGETYYRHPAFRPTTFSNWWEEGPTYDYKVLSDRIQFISNNPREVLVRYLIVADDAVRTTGGNAAVIRGSEALGYSQICRPGAQNPPRLGDIIVDSRLHQIPVVAQGFIPWADFSTATDQPQMGTHRAPDVAVSNTGFFLFPKFSVVMPLPGGSGGDSYGAVPTTFRFQNAPNIGNWNGQLRKSSVTARVENGYVRFYASPNSPDQVYWRASPSGTPPNPPEGFVYHGSPPLGVRYYVLAIPNSL